LLGGHCTSWTTLPALFCVGYFQDKVLPRLALNWAVLLISASQVTRITGVSHQHLALFCILVLHCLGFCLLFSGTFALVFYQ
jgi:hypothetical protein